MRMIRMLGSAAAMAAMVGMAVPASAQRWGHGPYHGGHHHHGDGIDGGDVLLGALLAGGIIAVASAASKPRAPAPEPYDAPPPPPAPPAYEAPRSYNVPPPPGDGAYEPGPGAFEPEPSTGADIGNADEAADACAAAAEAEGTRYSRLAHVLNIASVDPSGPNWAVRGTLELRDSYRSDGTTRGFRCMIVGSAAPDVRIDGLAGR